MNTFRLLLMITLLWIAPSTLLAAAVSDMQSATIQVDGLSCPFCAYGLEKHLKKIKGVKYVEINMKSGNVIVQMKPDAYVDD